MKKLLLLCLLILFSFLKGFAQSTDTTKHTQRSGFVISMGAGLWHFYNGNFIDYIINFSGGVTPANVGNWRDLQISGNTSPTQYNLSNSSINPNLGAGVVLYPPKSRMHCLLALNYGRISGTYGYYDHYSENYQGGAVVGSTSVSDIIKSSYLDNVLSVAFKFQPTYKFIFMSFGLNLNLNLLKVTTVKNEWQYTIYNFEGSLSYSNANILTNSASNFYYVTAPLQVGIGTYLNSKKIAFEPGVYFSYYLLKNYFGYDFALDVVYKIQ